METRRCTKCKEEKSLGQFGKMAHAKDGIHCWCRECSKKDSQRTQEVYMRQNTGRNPYIPGGLKRCRVCRKELPLTSFNRNTRTKDGLQIQCRECQSSIYKNWKGSGTEARRERYQRGGKEKSREYARTRNALAKPFDRTLRAKVWKKDNGTCYLCGAVCDPKDWHTDHVLPLSKGGAHHIDNIRVSCPPCNRNKHTRII